VLLEFRIELFGVIEGSVKVDLLLRRDFFGRGGRIERLELIVGNLERV
jgi:hypothetical protein